MRKGAYTHLTQKEILKAAHKILVKEGYKGLSTRKLAALLNCSSPTIYYYFKNKNEIIASLIIEGHKLLAKAIKKSVKNEADPVKSVELVLRSIIKFSFNRPGYYKIMFALDLETDEFQEELGACWEMLMDVINEITDKAREVGYIKTTKPTIVRAYTIAMLNGVISMIHNHRTYSSFTEEELTESAVKVLMHSYQYSLF